MERKGKEKGRTHLNGIGIQEGVLWASPGLQKLMEWGRQWWQSRVCSLLSFLASQDFESLCYPHPLRPPSHDLSPPCL